SGSPGAAPSAASSRTGPACWGRTRRAEARSTVSSAFSHPCAGSHERLDLARHAITGTVADAPPMLPRPYTYRASTSSGSTDEGGGGARSGSATAEARVEGVAQAVAEQVDGEHQCRDRQAGEGRQPPGLAQELAAVVQ